MHDLERNTITKAIENELVIYFLQTLKIKISLSQLTKHVQFVLMEI